MTTRDKGITLPILSQYQTFGSGGISTTTVPLDYTPATSWIYGAGFTTPINAAPLTAMAPVSYSFFGQNAAAGFSNTGGAFLFFAGVGSGGNSSGNLILKDTSGAGGSWSTSHYVQGNYHQWFDANGTLRWKASAPTVDQDGIPVGFNLQATAVYDTPSLADGVGTTTTIAIAGAVLGDFAIVSFDKDLQGILVTAYVSAANTVSIRFQNESGGTIDLASGNLRVKVVKQ